MGRPSKYTIDLAKEICDRLAQGESVRQMCRDDHMPDASNVVRWAQSKIAPEIWDEGEEARDALSFAQRYARATEIGLQLKVEEMHEIAADGSNDWIDREVKAGRIERVVDHEHVNRSKLRVDAIKWDLSKRLRGTFGDKLSHEHSGPGGGPIETKNAIDGLVSKLDAVASRQQPADEADDGGNPG